MTNTDKQTAESKLAEAREWADWYETNGERFLAEQWRLKAAELTKDTK